MKFFKLLPEGLSNICGGSAGKGADDLPTLRDNELWCLPAQTIDRMKPQKLENDFI
jgi:hypothetical protein